MELGKSYSSRHVVLPPPRAMLAPDALENPSLRPPDQPVADLAGASSNEVEVPPARAPLRWPQAADGVPAKWESKRRQCAQEKR